MTLQFKRLLTVAALLYGATLPATAGERDADLVVPPPLVDLRPDFEKHGLDVRQQGKCGACQVLAMVGVIEFQLAKRGQRVDLSEQFIMWAANHATGRNRVDGFNPDLLIAGLKQYGICDELLMPYVPRNEGIAQPSADAIQNAKARSSCKVTWIKHWTSNIGFVDKDIKEITSSLEDGTPVTSTLCWPSELNDEQIVDARHFIIDKNIDGKSKNGHGVILVGYALNDKMTGKGYFILRNSWGPGFANQGYAKITFEFAKKYGTDAYIVSVR